MSNRVLQLNLPHYSVSIVLADAGMDWIAEEIGARFRERKPRLMIVTDERVALHYEHALRNKLRDRDFEVFTYAFPPGESHKNLRQVGDILDALAERQFARDDFIIGLGGGVTTDIAGFAASIYRRGIGWIAVPTSLMAVVDAAIGGKTGVDHVLGKNLIGSFHQPAAVLAPLDSLMTLDAREWISGSAEVVKAGLLSGGRLWELLLNNGPDLYLWLAEERSEALSLALAKKIEVVSQDEREGGIRKILNFGHTFGHAFEAATGYAALTHGEAVFCGMRAAAKISCELDLLPDGDYELIDKMLAAIRIPRVNIAPETLITCLAHDKKISDRKLNWVMLRSIGNPVITADVSDELIAESARWLCQMVAEGNAVPATTQNRIRIAVINGPNLNLLGMREKDIYGDATYDDQMNHIQNHARQCGAEILIRQSNQEGDLVDLVQRARYWADGIVLNPGGYTHTSVALRDALAAIGIPAIEVHLSDISRREEFRRTSLIAPVCRETISGLGITGYIKAIDLLISMQSNFNLTTEPSTESSESARE